jgi:hypothetical protein
MDKSTHHLGKTITTHFDVMASDVKGPFGVRAIEI